MVLNLGILISGNGSNMVNIAKQCKVKNINCNIKIVLSNKNCGGIKKAEKLNLKSMILEPNKFKNRELYENKVSKLLRDHNVNLVCLAGYMLKLGKKFVKKWEKKIINIHPSLLPAFKGLNAQEQAYKRGVMFTGCTIHYVDQYLDSGQIIDQRIVKVDRNKPLKDLVKKILNEEHKLYINVLKELSKEN